MKKYALVLCLSLFGFWACSPSSETIQSAFHLEWVGQKSLNLDFETNKYGHIQYWESGSKAQVIFGNGETNQLKFYDYHSGNLINSISFSRNMEGPDRFLVGYFKSFHVLSPDSILSVIDEAKEFILADGQGNILRRERLEIADDHWASFPGLHDFFPPAKVGNKLYIHQGWGSSDVDNLIFEWDLAAAEGNSLRTKMSLPPSIDAAWRKSNVYHWKNYPYVYVADIEAFVFSFNGSQDLHITKDFSSFEAVPAASSFIKEMPAPDITLNNEPNKLFADFNQRSFYRSLLYDPYRGHYYRFASLAKDPPIGEENSNRRFADMSIIVLDSDFQILTEHRFRTGKKYSESSAFINEAGLHMAFVPTEGEPDDEELIVFDVFRLIEK